MPFYSSERGAVEAFQNNYLRRCRSKYLCPSRIGQDAYYPSKETCENHDQDDSYGFVLIRGQKQAHDSAKNKYGAEESGYDSSSTVDTTFGEIVQVAVRWEVFKLILAQD